MSSTPGSLQIFARVHGVGCCSHICSFVLLAQGDGWSWNPKTLWHEMGWVEKTITFLLLGTLVWAFLLILNRVLALATARKQSALFANELRGASPQTHIDEVLAIVDRYPRSYRARLISEALLGLKARNHVINESLRREVQATSAQLSAEIDRNLRKIAMIASVAPVLGLLGTVVGLTETFKEMGANSIGSASLAQGVASSLVTTAVALAISIPCFFAYKYLQHLAGELQAELGEQTLRFTGRRRTDGPSRLALFSSPKPGSSYINDETWAKNRRKIEIVGAETIRADESAADPPRSAYALLSCEEPVFAGHLFEVTVGLTREKDPKIAGDAELKRPASSVGPYTLSVQVAADGFALKNGETWRHDLRVTAEQPYPQFKIHLIPEALDDLQIWSRTIQAIYSIEGQTIGVAIRAVAVARSADLAGQSKPNPKDPGTTFAIPSDVAAPDLTVRILYGKEPGRLLFSLSTPFKSVSISDEPLVVTVGTGGDGPKEFARALVDSVNVREGKPGLYNQLLGHGRELAEKLPAEFWDTLRLVTRETENRVLTILILSQEPYIPWELAVMEPPLDSTVSPFLGAQATIGRWVLKRDRPKLPPPSEQSVKDIAVVSGIYDALPGWRRLAAAEKEADEMESRWGAAPVNALTPEILNCISGQPSADVLHFAIHGIYDPTSTQNGLIMVDGEALDPATIKGTDFKSPAFVFLNACQVGAGSAILGDYSGIAAAFLDAGASGVIAPLWSIKDTIAKDIALRFYDEVFGGLSAAEFLRRERQTFTMAGGGISATPLAYQFFGHPAMKLKHFSRGEDRHGDTT
jgi:biopolymer transport protein ExbB/TolQ